MRTPTPNLTTARDLLFAVESFGPLVLGDELVFSGELSAELEPVLSILHTGVRAQLVKRKWYGCEGETGRVIDLSPAAPILPEITLLCVEGDERWDRIHPAARLDRPELFVPSAPKQRSR
jgi:hypothetical protein